MNTHDSPKPICMLGMHRSGTSAVSRLLNLLGVHLGPGPQIIPPAPDNPKGFWEHHILTTINDEILTLLGGSWHEPPVFPPGWETSSNLADLRQRARAVLQEDFGGTELWGWKDPRTCLTLSFWQNLLPQLRYVICVRNPLDVARSLERRDAIPLEKGVRLWLIHMTSALQHTTSYPRLLIFYEDIMENWRRELRRLASFLGRPEQATRSETLKVAREFLEEELQHHRTQAINVVDEPQVVFPAKALYFVLYLYRSGSLSKGRGLHLDKIVDVFGSYAWEAQVSEESAMRSMAAMRGQLSRRGQEAETLEDLVAELRNQAKAALAERETHDAELLGQLTAAEAVLREREARETELRAQLAAAEAALGEREKLVSQFARQTDELHGLATRLNSELIALQTKLGNLSNSLFWRAGQKWIRVRQRYLDRIPVVKNTLNWGRLVLMRRSRLTEQRQLRLADSPLVPPQPRETETVGFPPLTPQARSVSVQSVDVGRAALATRPRIVFVSGEAQTPGHFYRVVRYAEAAAAAGADARVMAIEDAQTHLVDVSRAELVVIWRAAWDDRVDAVVRTARASGAKVLFDVDDLMFDPELATIRVIDGIRSQGMAEKPVQEFFERVRATLFNADVCTAPTASLAQRMRRPSEKPVFILPNGFDAGTLEVSRMAVRSRRRTASDKIIRIGYATGSRTHQRDFSLVAGPISRVLRSHPECCLVLFRRDGQEILDVSEFPEFVDLMAQIEWRPFVPLAELPAEIARFDINLAPLEAANPFCEAKSELKFVEAALAGVPTIASPTEPFRQAIQDGVTGFLASTPEEWCEAIERLVTDRGLRARIAQAAFYDVLWTYGPERRTEIMVSLVEQVLQGGRWSARAFELDLARYSYSRSPVPLIPDHDILFESDKLKASSVTIIVPLYDYASHVEEALSSVSAQTLADLDLVVVDDASTDNSLGVARQWLEDNEQRFNRVVLARNRVNSGLGLTRNVGFALAETAYVLPLDADNQLMPDCAARCLSAIQDSTAAFAYPLIQQFANGNGTMGTYDYQPARFRLDNYIDAMALIRKAAWALVGGYWETRIGWEDYDLWCKFVERGLFGVQVREMLARYRVHESSMHHTTPPSTNPQLVAGMMSRHPWLTFEKPAVTPSPVGPERIGERDGDLSGPEPITTTPGQMLPRQSRLQAGI